MTEPVTYRIELPRYDLDKRPYGKPYCTKTGKLTRRTRRPVWDPLHGNGRPGHWSQRSTATARVINDVMWRAKAARIPAGPHGHVTVQLVWAPGDRRRADADNLWPLLKVCCDALARGRKDLPGLHLVPDDTPAWMTKPSPIIAPPPASGLWLDVTVTPAAVPA